MKFEVEVTRTIKVPVDLQDVLASIEEAEMYKKWDFAAQIIHNLDLNIEEMTEVQKATVLNWLNNKVKMFKK